MTLIMPASFPGACGPVCSSYVKQTAAQSCSFNLTLALAACFWVSHSSDGVQDAESSAPGSCSHSRHSWSVAGIRGSVESSQCLRSPCVASSAGARSQAWTAGRAWLGHWRPGRGRGHVSGGGGVLWQWQLHHVVLGVCRADSWEYGVTGGWSLASEVVRSRL